MSVDSSECTRVGGPSRGVEAPVSNGYMRDKSAPLRLPTRRAPEGRGPLPGGWGLQGFGDVEFERFVLTPTRPGGLGIMQSVARH